MTEEILRKDIAKIIIRYIDKWYWWEELYWGDDLYNYTETQKEVVMDMYNECIEEWITNFKEKHIK